MNYEIHITSANLNWRNVFFNYHIYSKILQKVIFNNENTVRLLLKQKRVKMYEV